MSNNICNGIGNGGDRFINGKVIGGLPYADCERTSYGMMSMKNSYAFIWNHHSGR